MTGGSLGFQRFNPRSTGPAIKFSRGAATSENRGAMTCGSLGFQPEVYGASHKVQPRSGDMRVREQRTGRTPVVAPPLSIFVWARPRTEVRGYHLSWLRHYCLRGFMAWTVVAPLLSILVWIVSPSICLRGFITNNQGSTNCMSAYRQVK